MSSPKKFTEEQMAKAIVKNKGLVYNTAAYLKCTPQTVYNYIKDSQVVADAMEEANGQFLDLAEQRLYEAVDRGENWAIPFYLRTKGKTRGYIEKQEIKQELSGPNGGPVQLDIDDVTNLTPAQRTERLAALLESARNRRDIQPT